MPTTLAAPTTATAPVLPEGRVLAVEGLTVRFATAERTVDAVRGLSFHVERGETLAIVGESGSGKSVTSLALMRLVEWGGGHIISGSMLLRRRGGEVLDLARAAQPALRGIRGADIAMIFQEPMTSLNPVFTAGDQIAEAIAIHQGKSHAAARAEALRMLELVRIPEARSVLQRYPHQLSGGMRQRVMIAMALSCKPALLIADEPTTALDVTIQAQILALLRGLRERSNMTVILITHDMGVIAQMCDRVGVMYAGELVEVANVEEIFAKPGHPYTEALFGAIPSSRRHGQPLQTIPGQVPDLSKPLDGCRFKERCRYRIAQCDQPPALAEISPSQAAACWKRGRYHPDGDPRD